MGCGASVAKTNVNRRPIDALQPAEVPLMMASVQGSMMNKLGEHDEFRHEKQIIQIQNGRFAEQSPTTVETDDMIEFQCFDAEKHDVIQVYKDGNDFYEVHNGFQLRGINKKTDVNETRIVLSFGFNDDKIDLYFCVLPSTSIDRSKKQRKYPKEKCEPNHLIVEKPKFLFEFNDKVDNQKVYLHQNDQIEIHWESSNGIGYRIEERKYCPVSAGFYVVESNEKENQRRTTTRGKFIRQFPNLGTSFLCRFNEKNELHDITVCIVSDSYRVSRITFQDDFIDPNIIDIEQGQVIEFNWNTKRKLTFSQIEPFRTDEKSRKSIKLQNANENFFWPYDATRRGQMYYQFNEPGLFCFKVENDKIGTIIVYPRKTKHQISLTSNQLIHKMNANELLQFVWKTSDFTDEKVLITIDSNTSVIPTDAISLRGLFHCEDHRCSSAGVILQECLHTCEIFLMDLPKHGLYQFSISTNVDRHLLSVIVENGIDYHHVQYDNERLFEDKTIIINQNDKVWFESKSNTEIGFVYETDEYGRRLSSENLLFEPQPNSLNYFVKQFHQLGIFYFSVDFDPMKVWKNTSTQVIPLAIVVIPDIKFHYNLIGKNEFDSRSIMTHLNDFVIWQFDSVVSHNLVQLPSNAKLTDLQTCHQLSKVGRNRHCLGLECIRSGAFFFANPEFERFAGSDDTRLLSTVIIDVPFGEKCLVVSNHQFSPNVLYIAQGDTISWTMSNEDDDSRITVQEEKDTVKANEELLIDRNLETFLDRIHHLHTFRQPGKYIVRSNSFENSATIIVESEKTIQNEIKRVLTPKIQSTWNVISQYGDIARLFCPNRTATIYYTLDGSMPTRFVGDVRPYQDSEGVVLTETGLHVLRAFAFENGRVPSYVMTSPTTYIMESEEYEANKMRRAMWESGKVLLSGLLQRPNKIYGKIQVEPSTLTDLTDHYTLYIGGLAQNVSLAAGDIHFSAEGFAGGEQYEIHVVAHPKSSLIDASPITSNKLAFEIQREYASGGPLLSLGVPNDSTSVFLLWAPLGDHVEEYVVCVDDVPTRTIAASSSKQPLGLHLLGAQLNRNYLLHVEAKLKESQKICKSNVVSVRLPLQRTVQDIDSDERQPYITVMKERAPTDAHLDELSVPISSPKLSYENSSSLDPPQPLPTSSSPATSSRSSPHRLDINPTTLSTSDLRPDNSSETAHQDKMNQTDDLDVVSSTDKKQKRASILSDDAKRQADILLNQLTKAIENRSNMANKRCPHVHSTYPEIQLFQSLHRPIQTDRTFEKVPISFGFRNAVPSISYRHNKKGITCILTERAPGSGNFAESYRLIVDGEPYGKLIAPQSGTKFQINLAPGNHECFLQVIPKDKEENPYKSNLLKITVPSPAGGIRGESKPTTEQSNVPIHSVLDKRDLPVAKLMVQTVSKMSIRARWSLDRPLLKDAFVAIYELHIRGDNFTDQVNSDETYNSDGSTEHVWNLTDDFLEIQGVSDRQEYTLFVRTYFHVNGLTDIEYAVTQSSEVTTARLDSPGDFLPRPLLSVSRLDVQMAVLSWKLPDTEAESLVKGYRVYLNSKPTELLSAKQNTYELTNLKPGTSNEVQVAVSASSNYADDQISEPIRIECPQRPSPPEIEVVRAENPFSIQIQWKIKAEERDQIHSFKVFLNNELHEQVRTSGRQTFKHEFAKLDPDQTYLIYVKSFVETQKLDGYSYQCSIESNASREISRRCAAPPKGTIPRLERMYPNGVHLEWDEPEQTEEIKATGYLLLKDGRVVGKPIQINQRRASINDLDVGNRYAFQVLPLTDQVGAPKLRTGEVYDPKRHAHYLPGPKLDVEFTDLIKLPKKIEIENVTGHTAMLCWSPIDQTLSSHVQPEFYNIKIWNNKDLSKDDPKLSKVLNTETSAHLTDLQSETVYFIQMEACQNRRHPTTNDHYLVVTTSDVVRFQTGAPPKPPTTMRLIACTNTAARLNFDPFIECRAEIIEIRVHVKPEETSSSSNNRTLVVQLTPDKTEVVLRNLIESTRYSVTLYAITQEYLDEIGCPDSSSLQDELTPSHWLPSKSMSFTTSGCKPATDIRVVQSTVKAIKLEWKAAEATGSTEILGQNLRWKSRQMNETQIELNRGATRATIPGVLLSGRYTIYLDTIIRYQVNLEEAQDENNQKEKILTNEINTDVVFEISSVADSPELYVTGYTLKTIELEWEKPDMFSIIDHPEKAGEQIKLHRKLVGYVLHSRLINGRTEDRGKTTEFSDDQTNCELTGGLPGAEYQITLKAKTILRPESISDESIQNRNESNEPEESPPRETKVKHLAETDVLHGLHAQIASTTRDDESNRDDQAVPKKQIEVNWQLAKDTQIHSFILRWHSSKNLEIHQTTIENSKRKAFIDVDDPGYFYTIYLDIIKTNKRKLQYSPVHLLVPSAPEPPKLFLVKTTDTSFTVEWSEPRTHGIPIIGYELFISGKRHGETIKVDSRQAEIPSRINRTYQVKICALTNDQSFPRSIMSPALTVITTPTTNLVPTIAYHNDDGNIASFDRTVARIIPVQIESINEEKLHVQWTSFLPTAHIRAYYIHYTCLNTGEIQAMKISKRFREAVLRGLRPGFTYGIIVLAVDKNGGVLYTSDKTTVQMNAPPNAPIVAITERTNEQVRVEWRPAASYGVLKVVGYKIFVNNRLAAILSEDQLSYTLKNGTPCETYTIQVQALSNDKNILSPVSRIVQFNWPGIRPGAFRRVDDGQTGTILFSWEHPKFEDDTEKLLAFKLISENLLTREFREHGEFDAATHQASVYDLNPGKYRLWLEIQGETHRTRARPITVNMTRANSSINRTISFDSTRYLRQGQNGFRQPIAAGTMTGLRRSRY